MVCFGMIWYVDSIYSMRIKQAKKSKHVQTKSLNTKKNKQVQVVSQNTKNKQTNKYK